MLGKDFSLISPRKGFILILLMTPVMKRQLKRTENNFMVSEMTLSKKMPKRVFQAVLTPKNDSS